MAARVQQKKQLLSTMLNAALELRNTLKRSVNAPGGTGAASTPEQRAQVAQLLSIAGKAQQLATDLPHPHGRALATELLCAGRLLELAPGAAGEEALLRELGAELDACKAAAKEYGDVPLALRVLELAANVARRAGDPEREARVAQLAVQVGGRTPRTAVALAEALGRLLEAAHEASDAVREREDEEGGPDGKGGGEEATARRQEARAKRDAQLLELHLRLYHELAWLAACQGAEDEAFDFDAYAARHKADVFRTAVYVGTSLANPYVSELRPEDMRTAQAAFVMAEHVAGVVCDDEYLCVAAAARARCFYGRATQSERESIVASLRALEEQKAPQADDIRQLLRDIAEQRVRFPQ